MTAFLDDGPPPPMPKPPRPSGPRRPGPNFYDFPIETHS